MIDFKFIAAVLAALGAILTALGTIMLAIQEFLSLPQQ